MHPVSEEQIAGQVVVNDLTGKPALVLTIRMPRTIHERARTTLTYFTVFLQLVGLAFGLSMVVLIEKVVLSRLERLAASVHALRERGDFGASRVDASGRDELSDLGHFHVSIDDFGTGYSSLSYLHLFPVDFLKIDRSFVNSMHAVSKQHRIVETILLLARNLGVGVIAEGVEDEAQRAGLRELGCLLGQGYLFSKPVDAAGARRLLATGVATSV